MFVADAAASVSSAASSPPCPHAAIILMQYPISDLRDVWSSSTAYVLSVFASVVQVR